MGLLQNISVLSAQPIRNMGGAAIQCVIRSSYNRPEQNMNMFVSYADVYDGAGHSQLQKAGNPNGYAPPYQFAMPIKDGGMATQQSIYGGGVLTTISLSMGGGMACPYPQIVGAGEITTAAMSVLIQLATSAIIGTGGVTGPVQMILSMAADVAAGGDIDGSLGLIAWCVGALTGAGGADGSVLRGESWMSASIVVTGDVLTAQSVAAEVWNSLAAAYNNSGSMGEKLNDAGSASNPWTEIIEAGLTAEDILKIVAAALAGKVSGAGTPIIAFRNLSDTKDAITAVTDDIGNRITVDLDP